ncbi:MAG: tetratricopeptide repeat protein [Candidatus Cloacimonetes bacterium]|nr:tetratricopeptide repeat protein [Candidatus Cloacimonadota bacterium]
MTIFRILLILLSLSFTSWCSSQAQAVLATGSVDDLEELVRKTPIEDPVWVEAVLEFLKKKRRDPQDLWVFSLTDNKAVLSDDPTEIFRAPMFPGEDYQLRFDVLPPKEGNYARQYVANNHLREAVFVLQKLEKTEPNNLYLLFNLARLYELEGYADHARQRLEIARELGADQEIHIFATRWLIRIYSRLGRWDQVLEELERLQKVYNSNLQSVRKKMLGVSETVALQRLKQERLKAEQEMATVQNAIGVVHFVRKGEVLAFDRFATLDRRFPGVFVFTINRNKVWLERRRYESTLKSTNSMLTNLSSLSSRLRDSALKTIRDGDLSGGQILATAANHFQAMISLLYTRRGEILYREKHYDQARIALRQAILQNPSDAVSYYRLGQIQTELKQYSEALISFRKVIEHTLPEWPLHREALLNIDHVFNEEAKLVLASSDPLLKKRDEYFQTLSIEEQERILGIAEIVAYVRRWFREGQFQKIVEELRLQYAEHQDVMEIPFWLARAYQELSQPILAEFFFDRVLELTPDYVPALVGKIWYLSTRGDFAQAVTVLEKLKALQPDSSETQAAFGWYFYQRNQLDRAILAYQRAIAIDPSVGEHHYRLGMAYFRSKSYSFAAHKFEDAKVAGYPWGRVDLFRGLALIRDGKPREGENALLMAAKRGGDNPDIVDFARRLLADLGKVAGLNLDSSKFPKSLLPLKGYEQRADTRNKIEFSVDRVVEGKTLEVIGELEARLEIDKEDSELRFILGVLNLLVDREEQAEDYFEDSVYRSPYDYRSLNSLAEIAFRQGKIDQSLIYWERMKRVSTVIPFADSLGPILEAFSRLIEINPTDEWAVYHKALLLLHSRREPEALEMLQGFTTRPDRKTPFGDRIQILLGQIYYRIATTEGRTEFWEKALGILQLGSYRYLDVAIRYAKGIEALKPIPPPPDKAVIPVPDEQINYSKKSDTRDLVRNPPQPTYEGASRKDGDFIAAWKRVDQVLAKKEPKAVLSSYDAWLKQRTSSLQRYMGTTEVSRQEEIAKEWDEKSQALLEDAMKRAERLVYEGQISASMDILQEAASYRPQSADEAFIGILAILLLEGRYVDLEKLLAVVEPFLHYKHLTLMMQAHLAFHQGNFASARGYIEELPKEIVIPPNRILKAIFFIQTETARRAPADFETMLRLGLILMVTGQHKNAALAFGRAGEYRGLIPYRAEALIWHAVRDRRRTPAKQSLDLMYNLSLADKRDKYESLAKALDQFYASYRFVTE